MNAAAKRTMPLGLGIRVLARTGWPTCGSGLRACWSGSSKRWGCRGPAIDDDGGGRPSGRLFVLQSCPFSATAANCGNRENG